MEFKLSSHITETIRRTIRKRILPFAGIRILRFQLPLEKKVQLQRMIDGLKDGKVYMTLFIN